MVAMPSDAALENLLAFWAEAGVDACYEDQPVNRLAPPKRAQVPGPRLVSSDGALPAGQKAFAPGQISAEALTRAVQDASQRAAAANSLEALAAAIASFEGCPLRDQGATQAVFGRGNPQAPVLIVGEGPGAEEDQQGEPFVGAAGRLLNRMLDAAELSDQVFITNTVYWRPPGNRPPTTEEQAICAPFLNRTLALIQPRAVLLLGAAAARSILRTETGITRLRGQWGEWQLPEGGIRAPVLPTLHPAFLLRQPQAKRMAWQDMLSLKAHLRTDGDGLKIAEKSVEA
jgi:uracil-DNA glycosylase, family 4